MEEIELRKQMNDDQRMMNDEVSNNRKSNNGTSFYKSNFAS